MYEFKDTTPVKCDYRIRLPAESLLISNIAIENMVDGYQTLTVEGRSLISSSITSTKITGQDGKMFQSSTLPERNIKVNYMLRTTSNEDYREKYDLLNSILNKPEQIISFNDQPEYCYQATLSAVSEPQAGKNIVTGNFTFTASNPYKRRIKPIVSKDNTGGAEIVEPMYFETVPDSITLIPSTAATTISVTNGRQTINLTGEFAAGITIVINPKGEQYLVINGVYHPELFDWLSDLENFKVKTGDKVTVIPTMPISVSVRSERL